MTNSPTTTGALRNLSTIKFYAAIVWMTCAAIAVPIWAIAQQYRVITINAGAEDDCDYFYGAYALSEVRPVNDGAIHHVQCVYR